MWVCIPDEEVNEAWTGTISRGEAPTNRWKFELIRHVTELEDLHGTTPFNKQQPVVGLLDYQTRCTLIRPLINLIDPGSLGIHYQFNRTRIEGSFDALLTGLPISDPNEPLFLGLTFSSDAFTSWYSAPVHRHSFDQDTRTPELDAKPDQKDTFLISCLGTVVCTTGARFSNDGVYSTSIKSASLFALSFDEPKSLDETHSFCFGLERLFGFLIGHRGAMPEFSLWINKQYTLNDQKFFYRGTLEIGGCDYVEGKPPHPMRCIHRAGLGEVNIETVIGRFFSSRNTLMTRIHAVGFCRFFTTNLNDQFSVIMPVLEEYLKKRYTQSDEQSYVNLEKRFFDYVDKSEDEDLKNFCRKHISVKKSKTPSLTTLIERGVNHLKDKGFTIPINIAKQIQQRRGRVFHSTQDMTADDIGVFRVEITAAVALVLFHTFEDLGIDPALLADRHSGLLDMAFLMKRLTPPSRQGANSRVMTLTQAVKQYDSDGSSTNDSESAKTEAQQGEAQSSESVQLDDES